MSTSSQFQAAVDKAVVNMDRLNEFVNGDEDTVVNTDNGSVPSLEKLVADTGYEAGAAATAVAAAAAASVSAAAASVSAATAEAASGPNYASTAAGLAATPSGKAFAVDNGDGTVTVYLNSAGTAVAQRNLATVEYNDVRFTQKTDLAGSSGGALVGFLQGGIGAVLRTIQEWFRERPISPRDFGGVGDGVADDTVALQKAAATGKRIDLLGGTYLTTAAVTITNDVLGPGGVKSSGSMFVVGADGVTISGVNFEGTATGGTSVPVAVGSINRSKLTVRNCTIKNSRVWARNTATSRCTDFRFQNNTVDADYSLIEHITNQNDVLTVRGIDGAWITNNNFTIANVHRVIKVADIEQNITAGTDYRARNVFIQNNRIVGSTDSNKQVIDLYFFTSDITISGNSIEVAGFSSIIENKTGMAQNYPQNLVIADNIKLSNDKSSIVLQGSYGATTSGYDVGYQNAKVQGNTIISTASAGAAGIEPIAVRFYDDVKIEGNTIITPVAFVSGIGYPAISVRANANATVSENTITNGHIDFGTATTNQNGEPFAATMLSIIANQNTISNFGGTAVFGGIQVANFGTASSLRVKVDDNYLKQDVDDAASAGVVAVNNGTLHTVSVRGNIGVMAAPAEARLRLLSATVTSVIESGNSWNQIGRVSATYDPPSLAAGASTTTTLTVTGAALGDQVRVQFSRALQGLVMTAWISATDTVTVQFYNPTAGAIDLASGTLQATVERFTAV